MILSELVSIFRYIQIDMGKIRMEGKEEIPNDVTSQRERPSETSLLNRSLLNEGDFSVLCDFDRARNGCQTESSN